MKTTGNDVSGSVVGCPCDYCKKQDKCKDYCQTFKRYVSFEGKSARVENLDNFVKLMGLSV